MLALYTEWHIIMTKHLSKDLRYSLGVRIDGLFAQVLEDMALAQFSQSESKPAHLASAIGKNDTLKFMLYALYELNGIDEKKFSSLSLKSAEIGRMLYGWKMNSQKKTASPVISG